MTCWVIRSITKITTEYVRKEIPSGTTSIQFPAGVTIESYAFEGCTGLQQLDIPADAIVGDSAFEGCTGLQQLDIASGVTIGASAFKGCTGVQQLGIPVGCTLAFSAFEGCTGLQQLDIAPGVTIGASAFEGCTGLQQLDISPGVTLKAYAFVGCTGLKWVFIPEGYNVDANKNPFPAGIAFVRPADFNAFYSDHGSLKGLGNRQDAINIYCLFCSSDPTDQSYIKALLHLSASTMLDIIQEYLHTSKNTENSKHMSKMIAKKSGEYFFDSNMQEHLNLQDWTRMCLAAKHIAQSPTTLFASARPFNSPHTDVVENPAANRTCNILGM